MSTTNYQSKAIELDENDELAPFRDRFVNNNVIYLDGNSLGKLPKKSIETLQHLVTEQWGNRLIRAWNEHWLSLSKRTAAKIAQLVGAQADEIFVGDSTSVNLYKLAFAALHFQKHKSEIVSDSTNFPTDLYVLEGLIKNNFNAHKLHILDPKDGITILEDDLRKAINPNTALVCLSHVLYKSAFMFDMKKITDLAHQHGALTLWDLSHATGAVPIQLNASNADLAVGCTYKYLNGGPGAPAFLYVRKDLQAQLTNPIWAWFSHQKPFDFSPNYSESIDIQRFATSTPTILSIAPIEIGVDVFLEAGMTNIRAKSVQQSQFLLAMIQDLLVPKGFHIASPLDVAQRGSHISIQHPEGYRINKALITPSDGSTPIIPDFRPPQNIRLGIAPLYNSYMDLYQCVLRILKIMETKEYETHSKELVGVS